MHLQELNKTASFFPSTSLMPCLFLGHGSPMNAIEENEFVIGFRKIALEILKPKAILCISAHWETKGTRVTNMMYPRTIHDFGGFPKALFDVQYPAKGSPELAFEIRKDLTKTEVQFDENWGLDHGAWSVLKHLYPLADVPVIQMSLDVNLSPQRHYDVAKQLGGLRRKGILIIGSGNMIHNLGMVHWQKLNEIGFAYDWAIEAREKMNHFILNDDHDSLIHYKNNGQSFQLSIPTPEHYIPLLYVLALKEKTEDLNLFNDKALAGSLTMTSIKIG